MITCIPSICPVCKNNDPKNIVWIEPLNTVHRIMCKLCNTIYFDREPPSQPIYNLEYNQHFFRPGDIQKATIMALKLEKLCSEKWTHPLILEAGSGNGLTVFLLRAMRLNAFGVDIDPNLADYLMDKFKIPVISSHFENFDPGIEYQLIYSSHVIEHTLNPYKFMKKAYNLLEIGGIFFLDTPDTYYFDKEETRWHHFDTRNPFEHCCLLAKEGITHLAKEIGFKIDSITRYDEYQSQQAILVKV